MAKFRNERCVHCLGYFEKLTADHIFPRAWYPDSTPENIEKWTAPSCFKCNNDLEKVESDLYLKIGATMDYSDIAASGIANAAMSRIRPDTTSDLESKARRTASLKKLIGEVIVKSELPPNLMKNFGPSNGQKVYAGFNVDTDPLTIKIVRGLEYKLYNKRLVGPGRTINILNLPERFKNIEGIDQLNAILKEVGRKEERGRGFVVEHAMDKFGNTLYYITIWGRLELWASVTK